jgi:hypothetical protein
MSKMLKISTCVLFGLIIMSLMTTPVVAAGVDDYMPSPDAVTGYDLLWNASLSIDDPLNDTVNPIEVASQVWYKNDTGNNVIAVVGVMVIQYPGNPFSKTIPSMMRTAMQAVFAFDGNTYWALFEAILLSIQVGFIIEDITAEIQTTESSISIAVGDDYFVVSKDLDKIILTFAFDVSNSWMTWIETNVAEIQPYFQSCANMIIGLLSTWNSMIDILESFDMPFGAGDSVKYIPSPISSAIPSGSQTAEADVNTVTSGIGAQYSRQDVPGYELPLVILSMIGGLTVLYLVEKKKIRK